MRKSKERILSVVLTVVMVLSLFVRVAPMEVYAEDDTAIIQDLSSWVTVAGGQMVITPTDDSVEYLVMYLDAEEYIELHNYYKGNPVSSADNFGDFDCVSRYYADDDWYVKTGQITRSVRDNDMYCLVTFDRSIATGEEYSGYYAVTGVHAFKAEYTIPGVNAQPTTSAPTFDVEYGNKATYQWYESTVEELVVAPTAGDDKIQPTYTSDDWIYEDDLWKPNPDGNYAADMPFSIELKKGDTLKIEFSPSEKASNIEGIDILAGEDNDIVYIPASAFENGSVTFTAPENFVYTLRLWFVNWDNAVEVCPYVKATVEHRTAVDGQTTNTFTGEEGTYVCMATWGNYSMISDAVTVSAAPSYPYGDEIVDLGDDSITMDEENMLHFDIPENTGDYIYYPIVLPADYLGMSAEDYIDMMEKAVGESVVDVPGTLSMDNVDANRLLENDYRTIYTINADISDGIVAIPEEVYMKSVVCLLKLHKDNYIMETYDSADDNEYFEGLSDVTSIYAVYGVHAELVTPTGSGVPADGALIDSIDVQVDWDKVPELEVGMNYDNLAELEENILTATGTGLDEYVDYFWAVKLTEDHKITEEDDYYEELLEEWGDYIEDYNEYIDYVIESFDGWTYLGDILEDPYYSINEKDTYGLLVSLYSLDGYIFGEEGYDTYEGEVTGNVECAASVGFESSNINLFLKLGTLAEMEAAKNPPVVEKPVISGQPESSSVKVGEKATFSVTATGEGVTYQWMIDRNDGKGFVAITNATDKTYTTSVVDIDCNGFKYKCIITNEGGSVETATVTLKVTAVEENKDNDAAGDEGELEKDAQVAEDAPIEDAALNNTKEELLEAGNIFTEAEKQQIAEGADAKVWLEINKLTNIAATDKKKIEEKATSVMGESFNITYFDAKLFKQVGDRQAQTVSEPGMKIKVAIKLPATLINTDKTINREYKILRLHEGDSQATVINGTFNPATGEVTFETDKFSTYAIVYKDVPVETNDNNGDAGNNTDGGNKGDTTNNDVVKPNDDQKGDSPITGDSNNAFYAFALMLVSGLGILLGLRRKEKYADEK